MWKYIGINPFYNEIEENEYGLRRARVTGGYIYEKDSNKTIHFGRIKSEDDLASVISSFSNSLFASYFHQDLSYIFHIYSIANNSETNKTLPYEKFCEFKPLLSEFLTKYDALLKIRQKDNDKFNEILVKEVKFIHPYYEFNGSVFRKAFINYRDLFNRIRDNDMLVMGKKLYENGKVEQIYFSLIPQDKVKAFLNTQDCTSNDVIALRNHQEQKRKENTEFIIIEQSYTNIFKFNKLAESAVAKQFVNTYYSDNNFDDYQYDNWLKTLSFTSPNSNEIGQQFVLSALIKDRKREMIEIGVNGSTFAATRLKDTVNRHIYSLLAQKDISDPFCIPFSKDLLVEKKGFVSSVKAEKSDVKTGNNLNKTRLFDDNLKIIWLTAHTSKYMKELCDYMESLSSPFIVLVDDFKQWYAKEFNNFWNTLDGFKRSYLYYREQEIKPTRAEELSAKANGKEVQSEIKRIFDFGIYTFGMSQTSEEIHLDKFKEYEKLKRQQKKNEKVTIQEDEYLRVPYQALSKIGTPTGVLNKNLNDAISQALSNFKKNYDIDTFVAKQVGIDFDTLKNEQRLSCEQIDAIGLAIQALNAKSGFILADETGFGKGRVLASIILAGLKQGKNVLFVTEKAQLFSDMYRDLKDVDPDPNIIPTLLHSSAKIYDQNAELITKSKKSDDFKKMLDSDWSKADKDRVIFTTYSQLGLENIDEYNKQQIAIQEGKTPKKLLSTPKVNFLKRRLGDNCWIVLDEAHNAAGGTSNVSRNLIHLTKDCGVIFSSATYAKTEKNLELYNKILNLDDKSQKLVQESLTGDDYLLRERLVLEMAKNGKYIRREHPPIDLPTLLTKPTTAKDIENYERFSNFWISVYNVCTEIENALGNNAGQAWERVGGLLFRSIKEFSMLSYTDFLIDNIEDFVKNKNEKVVITLEMTLGAAISDYINKNTNESETDSEEESESEETNTKNKEFYRDSKPLLWQERFYPLINKLLGDEALEKIFKRKKEHIPHFANKRQELLNLIPTLPEFEISPIDKIIRELKKRGIEAGELSGRNYCQIQDGNDFVVKNRVKEERVFTVKRFNSGEFDVIFVTLAGCSGISLHAGAKFKDQRVRNLIELDITANTASRIQFLGRVRRKDQVVEPNLWTAHSDTLANIRLIENENRKRKKLAAHTGSITLDRTLGVISTFGENITEEWANYFPDYAKMVGSLYRDVYSPYKRVNKTLARSVLLPYGLQEILKNMLKYGIEISNDYFQKEQHNIDTVVYKKCNYFGDKGFYENDVTNVATNAKKLEHTIRILFNDTNKVDSDIIDHFYSKATGYNKAQLDKERKLNARQVYNLLLNSWKTEPHKNNFYFNRQKPFIDNLKDINLGNIVSLSKPYISSKTYGMIVSFEIHPEIYNAIFENEQLKEFDKLVIEDKSLLPQRNQLITSLIEEKSYRIGLSQIVANILFIGDSELTQVPLFYLWNDKFFNTNTGMSLEQFKLGQANSIIQTIEGNPILLADVTKKNRVGEFININDKTCGNVTAVIIENDEKKRPFISTQHLLRYLMVTEDKVSTLDGNLMIWWSVGRKRFTLSFDKKYYDRAKMWIGFKEEQYFLNFSFNEKEKRIEREFEQRALFYFYPVLNENNIFFLQSNKEYKDIYEKYLNNELDNI